MNDAASTEIWSELEDDPTESTKRRPTKGRTGEQIQRNGIRACKRMERTDRDEKE